MHQLKILIDGYAKKTANGWVASSSVVYINTGDKKIICDPGCNRKLLLEALFKEGLKTEDITHVFLSHQHPDHILLAGIFENAKAVTFDSRLIYEGDVITEWNEDYLGQGIKIIETPGHVLEHISLLVDTKDGKVVIAGDCIWWMNDETQVFRVNQADHFGGKGMDMNKLIESRKKIIKLADLVIPGHGKIFPVDKNLTNKHPFILL